MRAALNNLNADLAAQHPNYVCRVTTDEGDIGRTITLDSSTVDLLRAHKKAQAALKMRNRTAYHDHGLVFANEWAEVRKSGDTLGQPLQLNNLGQRE